MKKNNLLLLFFLFVVLYSCNNIEGKNQPRINQVNSTDMNTIRQNGFVKLQSKSSEANVFCKAYGLNTEFCFLIDLSMHSGLKRLYIWNFNRDTITNSFLVSHGCYTNPWGKDASKNKAFVSNEDGSHASSIGKYRIGNRGHSEWGIGVNYLLHGQESSNSNALKRQIVLHSWDEVADDEVYPDGTPEGWGCPAVSNNSMKLMDDMLQRSQKNVLLWVFQ